MRFRTGAAPVLALERVSYHCPKCSVPMTQTAVWGVSVEKCPQCAGTFFDRGEVEALLRRKQRLQRFKALRIFRWI